MNHTNPTSSNHPPPLSTVCHGHMDSPATGLCAKCLSDRLARLDPATVKSVVETGQSSRTSYHGFHELLRSQSCVRNLSNLEPRRRSCDVGARRSVSSMFDAYKDVGEQQPRTMKEHIDLECKSRNQNATKDLKNIWVAAAYGLSKKLQKWRHKQKIRTHRDANVDAGVENVNKMEVRRWRESQSEIGNYGFRRRSCDSDLRFPIYTKRSSMDSPTHMLAVFQDVISVTKVENETDKSPGGSEQTRNYYGEDLDLTRYRRSLDKSRSNRRASSFEYEELRAISNARLSPANVELFHGAKVLFSKNDVKFPNLSLIKTRPSSPSSSSKSRSLFTKSSTETKSFRNQIKEPPSPRAGRQKECQALSKSKKPR